MDLRVEIKDFFNNHKEGTSREIIDWIHNKTRERPSNILVSRHLRKMHLRGFLDRSPIRSKYLWLYYRE